MKLAPWAEQICFLYDRVKKIGGKEEKRIRCGHQAKKHKRVKCSRVDRGEERDLKKLNKKWMSCKEKSV